MVQSSLDVPFRTYWQAVSLGLAILPMRISRLGYELIEPLENINEWSGRGGYADGKFKKRACGGEKKERGAFSRFTGTIFANGALFGGRADSHRFRPARLRGAHLRSVHDREWGDVRLGCALVAPVLHAAGADLLFLAVRDPSVTLRTGRAAGPG